MILKLIPEDGKELLINEFFYNIQGQVSLIIMLFTDEKTNLGVTIGFVDNSNIK